MSAKYQLAQLNIGRMIGESIEDPVMKEFADSINEINTLAEGSEGYVWRFKDENNNATYVRPYDDDRIIVNMSVWESMEHLENFAYKGRHLEIFKKRRDWFERMGQPVLVLWYVPVGHEPTIEEAKERLAHLQEKGSTPYAFDFRKRYQPSELVDRG